MKEREEENVFICKFRKKNKAELLRKPSTESVKTSDVDKCLLAIQVDVTKVHCSNSDLKIIYIQ
jgi:hypothetical protein